MSILFKLTSRYRQNPKVVSACMHVCVCGCGCVGAGVCFAYVNYGWQFRIGSKVK